MLWIILSLITAFASASQDTWMKKHFSNFSAYEMLSYPMIYSFPFFFIACFLTPAPPLDFVFFLSFILSIPLNAAGFLIYTKAIRESPLSLTLPYLAFTPTFTIGTGYLFLGELPDPSGMIGILSTCLGSYILNFESGNKSLIYPIKALLKETGSWLMLIAAFIFSFGVVFGKLAIVHSSPIFFTMTFFSVLNLGFVLFLAAMKKIRLHTFRNSPYKGLMAGLLLFFHAIFHSLAVSMAKAAYMISIKRLSILFGMIYGGLVFKEKNLLYRFLGAIFMLGGAVIITLKGG